MAEANTWCVDCNEDCSLGDMRAVSYCLDGSSATSLSSISGSYSSSLTRSGGSRRVHWQEEDFDFEEERKEDIKESTNKQDKNKKHDKESGEVLGRILLRLIQSNREAGSQGNVSDEMQGKVMMVVEEDLAAESECKRETIAEEHLREMENSRLQESELRLKQVWIRWMTSNEKLSKLTTEMLSRPRFF